MGLWNYCEVCGERIETGQPCIGVKEESENLCGSSICMNCAKIENLSDGRNPVSITDLLACAEEAEERCKKLESRCKRLDEARERANEAAAKWEGMYRMALERAEREEETTTDLCDDFTDFVTGGVHNAAPYCANRRPECVNAHGWCDGDNRMCRGFMPKAAVRKEE